jgi:hypothetical protein
MTYKNSKWAKEILSLQYDEGMWGYFHTLSEPHKHPITTEQALRRLQILGYNLNDESIQKAVEYMSDCLIGSKHIPDRREKTHDWDIFTNLMLATWIRRFTDKNEKANQTADTWASIITYAFSSGSFSYMDYVSAYKNVFGTKPHGGRLIDFNDFYHVSLIADRLNRETEAMVFDYILNHKDGIYYIYDRQIWNEFTNVLPDNFASKLASRYIGAIELLSKYRNNLYKLKFAAEWIENNRNVNGKWDMGSSANDKVYFPLSDSWQRKNVREADCTYRIQNLLNSISLAL